MTIATLSRSLGGRLALCFWTAELIIGPQRISAVHRRGSTTHVDGESNRLGNLLTTGAMLMSHFGLLGNAAVAVDRDADHECHQFFRFRIDGFGGRCRC